MFDIQSIECPVGLPNGTTECATLVGSVCLSASLILTGVLFVQNLCCSSPSVSELIDALHISVYFDSKYCVIEDQMKELIGTRIRRDGLHYFSTPKTISTV